jgi:hypothetical protein
MKHIKQIALAILLLIPCLMQAQITYHYSMGYDANGSRISRLLLRKLDNPVTGTDSAVIAVADSALLNAINADKEEALATEQSIINVYPNPASDKVVVSYSATCPECLIRIFNVEAKQVYEAKGIDKETEIDISNLKSGVYYLSIITEDGKRQGWKIVKN